MMQITEDTPPDMLAGAMDLTVHLPTGRTVKMSVERSTPMMDLLVQITTAHHLQHSGHILQALEMAPSSSAYTDRVLPYKPNTPIGALDTQHVKVIPKNRSIPVPKNVSAGHQPFESTFRLQVHLPRNQLYVIRVSQNVYLGDIMKKVCEEKNLDAMKYEFRHPGNLDEVLDPKLTLSDYQITEVYIVSKGTVGLTQAFSSSDIMALRKEEERKQLQARTGGGVFSLIFKRGKTSMGSGSLSSENRSISPSHSDDSRSVTPPAIQQQILPPITQAAQPTIEKPKAPQRKRRPAPKPPQQQQQQQDDRKDSTDKPPSQISGISDTNTSDIQQKKIDNNGLTICHSRNSSDSSGYHEPSVLSDNCNTSLPRRPKSAVINEVVNEENQTGGGGGEDENSRSSIGNLSKMSTFSKSTTSITSRKKKAAPPPPPALKSETTPITLTTSNPEKASPVVVASPPVKSEVTDQIQPKSLPTVTESILPANETTNNTSNSLQTSPKAPPRNKVANETPKPTPRIKPVAVDYPIPQARRCISQAKEDSRLDTHEAENANTTNEEFTKTINNNHNDDNNNNNQDAIISGTNELLMEQLQIRIEEDELISGINYALVNVYNNDDNFSDTLVPENNEKSAGLCNSPDISESRKLPEVIAVIPKKSESLTSLSSHSNSSSFDTIGRKQGFNIGTSLLSMNDNEDSQGNADNISIHSATTNPTVDDYNEITDLNIEIFNSSLSKRSKNSKRLLHELHGIHDLDMECNMKKNRSVSSLRSSESMPSFLEQSNIKKWKNVQELDDISLGSDTASSFGPSRWVVGDTSDTESITTPQIKESPRTSLNSSSCIPSRQDSKIGTVPDGIIPPPPSKESFHENNKNSKKSLEGRESRNSIVLETRTSPKQSPSESVSSSKRSSYVSTRNSIVLDTKRNSINHEEIQTSPKTDFPLEISTNNHSQKQDDSEELTDLEWQYQLPSPPTAFRDSSPTNLTDVTNYDTITLQEFKEESVVTNPELFEKLKIVKESQCETETISDFNSVMSDDDKQMLSKLTLENLEKRKSLVYNRELSTSLKIAQENISSSSSLNNNSNSNHNNNTNNRNIDDASSKRSSMLSELEEVIQNGGSKSLGRHNSCVTEKMSKPMVDSNLPNFKISTYDNPKRKVNIFEDDSIRSNDNSLKITEKEHENNKSNNFNCIEKSFFTTKNSYIGRSMEDLSFEKQNGDMQTNDNDNVVFKKPQEFAKYKSTARSNFFVRHRSEIQTSSMTRSESFSMNYNNMPVWRPQNPVQRSKSQVALNKYKEEQDNKIDGDEGLSKCNSLFDVSGLQSLEVMRLIQTKLNTPSNSTEHLLEQEDPNKETSRKNSIEQTNISKPEPESTTNTKTYKYQGPPAINLSTWSERPKTKVSLKQDTDYKINDNADTKIKVTNNTEIHKPYINGINSQKNHQGDSNNVSIKINGTEPITTQESGNVVIKIGESQQIQTKPADSFSSRFINHSTAVGYRKPLANINKIDKITRPHSVAFESDFDISRVPIVRSVELKKPFKEINNTSITQINSINNESSINNNNKYSDIYKSTEAVNEINCLKQSQTKNSSVYLSSESSTNNRPVVRVNSFAQNRPAPVVMGFRGSEIVNDNTARSRKSWNVPNSYSTLPLKPNPEQPRPIKNTAFIPNSNVPFSQVTLKRVDSNKVTLSDNNGVNNVNRLFGNVVLRNTSPQIKNHVNNRYSTGSQFGVIQDCELNNKYSNGTVVVSAPPPPPVMPKVTSVTKKAVSKNPEPSIDSRDELLSSIRSFGGIKGLRHVKV